MAHQFWFSTSLVGSAASKYMGIDGYQDLRILMYVHNNVCQVISVCILN